MKRQFLYYIMFLFGGTGYAALEILWRGYTHWSMFLLGGTCFVLIDLISHRCRGRVGLWKTCLLCTFAIGLLEFATGCVVNLLLGWNVWNYSNLPFNLMGQVCLTFMALWFLLSIPVAEFARRMNVRLSIVMGITQL